MDKVPTNYNKVTIDFNGTKITSYKVSGDSRLLIYGMNLTTGKRIIILMIEMKNFTNI